jgi:hypothetical protein
MNSTNLNSINVIQNDKINSSLIKVQALQKEYDVTLQQYQEAGQNYISTLSAQSNDIVFSALKGRTWWGTNGLSEGIVNTQEECENMCANSPECSGATFNPVKRYCWTRTGDMGLSPGINSDYALITQQKASLSIMKYLNQRLLDINKQISDEVTNINPEVNQIFDEKNQKQKELNLYYTKLLQQKIELDKQLQEYNSIEEEENNQYITINQENISFRFWFLIAGLVVLITIQRIVGAKFNPLPQIIWFLIFILLIILTYSLSTPAGFLVWGVLLVSIILMKTGYLPSP